MFDRIILIVFSKFHYTCTCLTYDYFTGVIGSNIVSMESKEDYDKFREDILRILSDGIKNTHFVNFTEELVHSLCIHRKFSNLVINIVELFCILGRATERHRTIHHPYSKK